jgi:hypothetical protein
LILKTILGYGSTTGLWGFYLFSGLLREAGLSSPHTLYAPAAKWIALLAAASLPFALKFLQSPPTLFAQCGMTAFLFLFLSPGFGLQYLSWTVPWIVTLGIRPMASWYAVAGSFLLVVYVESCRGAGLNAYSDLLTPTNFGMLVLMGCICWLAVGVAVWQYGRRVIGPLVA